jgi:hypothetical protein
MSEWAAVGTARKAGHLEACNAGATRLGSQGWWERDSETQPPGTAWSRDVGIEWKTMASTVRSLTSPGSRFKSHIISGTFSGPLI